VHELDCITNSAQCFGGKLASEKDAVCFQIICPVLPIFMSGKILVNAACKGTVHLLTPLLVQVIQMAPHF
jgi:hypothetical protein